MTTDVNKDEEENYFRSFLDNAKKIICDDHLIGDVRRDFLITELEKIEAELGIPDEFDYLKNFSQVVALINYDQICLREVFFSDEYYRK